MEDIKDACALFDEFDTKLEAYTHRLHVGLRMGGENDDRITDNAREISYKLIDEKSVFLLGDASKDIFRQLLIFQGRNRILIFTYPKMQQELHYMKLTPNLLEPQLSYSHILIKRSNYTPC
jgi:hypothetical protein